MSFEVELKSRYADIHRRLLDPTPKPPPALRIVKSTPVKPYLSPLSTPEYKLTMAGLLQWVSKVEGMSVAELRGQAREKVVVRARFIFCYLARTYAGASMTQIGAFIGGRDHTTVMSAVAKIKTDRLTDEQLCKDVAHYEIDLDRQEASQLRCPHCSRIIPKDYLQSKAS